MKIPSFQYEILSKSFLSLESWLCIIHNVYSFQFTLSVPRWGKFSRQHFSTSFQNPPWKTFCWTVSGMFSQHKDKSRCWMTSWEPTKDWIEWLWCTQFHVQKHFGGNISGQKKVYFKDRWISLRCFDVYVRLLLEPETVKWHTQKLHITNYSLDFICQKRKRLVKVKAFVQWSLSN